MSYLEVLTQNSGQAEETHNIHVVKVASVQTRNLIIQVQSTCYTNTLTFSTLLQQGNKIVFTVFIYTVDKICSFGHVLHW
jgi:hypothetical protein